jgi:hypothetical protein
MCEAILKMLGAYIEGIVGWAERWLGGKLKDIRAFLEELFKNDLHAKRVDALAGATLGVMTSASLAVAMIGQSLAQARALVTRPAIKQVDRLLRNQKIDVWESFACWVPHRAGARREIVVARDGTDFERAGQASLVLNGVTGHGRAMPLLWRSVWKEELRQRRNDDEDACLVRLSQVLPPGVAVTILADRGFGDCKLFAFLEELGLGYVIRVRGNIPVSDAAGQTRPEGSVRAAGPANCAMPNSPPGAIGSAPCASLPRGCGNPGAWPSATPRPPPPCWSTPTPGVGASNPISALS